MIPRRFRYAKTSPILLGTLIVALLAAAGFWYYWLQAEKNNRPGPGREEYYLACAACENVATIPAAEARGRPKEDGKYQCPKCGEFAAEWVRSVEDVAAKKQNIVAP